MKSAPSKKLVVEYSHLYERVDVNVFLSFFNYFFFYFSPRRPIDGEPRWRNRRRWWYVVFTFSVSKNCFTFAAQMNANGWKCEIQSVVRRRIKLCGDARTLPPYLYANVAGLWVYLSFLGGMFVTGLPKTMKRKQKEQQGTSIRTISSSSSIEWNIYIYKRSSTSTTSPPLQSYSFSYRFRGVVANFNVWFYVTILLTTPFRSYFACSFFLI